MNGFNTYEKIDELQKWLIENDDKFGSDEFKEKFSEMKKLMNSAYTIK